MNITIKPRRYYKRYYNEDKEWYDILYTGNKWVYIIAEKKYDNPLNKFDKKFKWQRIKKEQEYINTRNIKIEEISNEDLFLEML